MEQVLSIEVGDKVQWVSQGMECWGEPRIIEKFYDNKHVKTRGSNTGIPVKDLLVVEKRREESAKPMGAGRLWDKWFV
tara:strand:+ start:377 stop:610 length:234 start_codon:yes stop_codon:yes gene_type:complete